MKTHDIFISYSSLDAEFVKNLVTKLRSNGVSLWFDRSEIKPGDYLRERINAAIDNVDYLLAVISPNSINSEWVRREIDAAMIRELDERKIRLIPLLIGDVASSNLPADIRGKNYLDFRKNKIAKEEFKRLLDLLKPEVRLRKEFLKELRAGMVGRDDPVAKLCEIACAYGDQTIQKAAIGGLTEIGTPEALVSIVKRLIDPWGMGTLSYCVDSLAKLAHKGGLIAITSTLFWDERFVGDKLLILQDALDEYGDFIEFLEKRSNKNGAISVMNIMAAVLDHTPSEISATIKFSSQYWWYDQESPFWLPIISYKDFIAAREKVDASLPGLTTLIHSNFQFRGTTEAESKNWVGKARFIIKDI